MGIRKSEIKDVAKKEYFQQGNYSQVAFIGLRKLDGSMLLGVPLYVKVNEVNANGMTASQEELMHRISEVMIERYESQISEYMATLKNQKELSENVG